MSQTSPALSLGSSAASAGFLLPHFWSPILLGVTFIDCQSAGEPEHQFGTKGGD